MQAEFALAARAGSIGSDGERSCEKAVDAAIGPALPEPARHGGSLPPDDPRSARGGSHLLGRLRRLAADDLLRQPRRQRRRRTQHHRGDAGGAVGDHHRRRGRKGLLVQRRGSQNLLRQPRRQRRRRPQHDRGVDQSPGGYRDLPRDGQDLLGQHRPRRHLLRQSRRQRRQRPQNRRGADRAVRRASRSTPPRAGSTGRTTARRRSPSPTSTAAAAANSKPARRRSKTRPGSRSIPSPTGSTGPTSTRPRRSPTPTSTAAAAATSKPARRPCPPRGGGDRSRRRPDLLGQLRPAPDDLLRQPRRQRRRRPAHRPHEGERTGVPRSARAPDRRRRTGGRGAHRARFAALVLEGLLGARPTRVLPLPRAPELLLPMEQERGRRRGGHVGIDRGRIGRQLPVPGDGAQRGGLGRSDEPRPRACSSSAR